MGHGAPEGKVDFRTCQAAQYVIICNTRHYVFLYIFITSQQSGPFSVIYKIIRYIYLWNTIISQPNGTTDLCSKHNTKLIN